MCMRAGTDHTFTWESNKSSYNIFNIFILPFRETNACVVALSLWPPLHRCTGHFSSSVFIIPKVMFSGRTCTIVSIEYVFFCCGCVECVNVFEKYRTQQQKGRVIINVLLFLVWNCNCKFLRSATAWRRRILWKYLALSCRGRTVWVTRRVGVSDQKPGSQ